MDNKFAIYNFLTGIKCKNKKPTYDEAYKRAFQLAWKDMATHTLKISENFKDEYNSYFNGESELKTKNRKWLKEQLADIIKKHFDELLEVKNKDDFSKCHNKICEYIVEKFPENKIKYRIDKKDKKETADVEIKCFIHILIKILKLRFHTDKLKNLLICL